MKIATKIVTIRKKTRARSRKCPGLKQMERKNKSWHVLVQKCTTLKELSQDFPTSIGKPKVIMNTD